MEFQVFVLYFLTALLALEGLSALARRRADPVRVRNRLHVLARGIAQVETEPGNSILRGGRPV